MPRKAVVAVASAEKKDRTFTVQGSEIGTSGGSYKASSPYNAGKKAARQLFRKNKSKKSIKFLLRETTQGSAKKVFFYHAQEKKLATPRVFVRNGVEIKVEKEITMKTCHENPSSIKI